MAAPAPQARRDLSMPGLLATERRAFITVPDTQRQASVKYSMTEPLFSALAMFSLKYSSLLRFDCEMRAVAGTVRHNLGTLFGVTAAPCDTQMRKILDPVAPEQLQPAFRALLTSLQRRCALKPYAWRDGKYLLALDGTGFFASNKISCPHCCVRHRKSGDEFYHQLLPAAIVHPDHRKALPLDFEPITHRDGNNNNDCERNAAGKRLLQSIEDQYPDRQFFVLEDALASNGLQIKELLRLKMDFIIGAKPGSNAALLEEVHQRLNQSRCIESDPNDLTDNGLGRGFRFTNNVALNNSHKDLMVNFLEYWEIDKQGKQTIFAWGTNLEISAEIASAGRTR